MDSRFTPSNQQSPNAPQLPGTWKLAAGRAITLQPREAGMLRVAHGRVWATFDGPHTGPRNDLGDHVLGAGERLVLRADQKLVIEAWSGESPAFFSWDPAPAFEPAASAEWVRVVQPLADLRLALSMAGAAALRLTAALAGLGWSIVTGRASQRLTESCRNGRRAAGTRPPWGEAGRAALWAAPR
jgi:hypothetical protein